MCLLQATIFIFTFPAFIFADANVPVSNPNCKLTKDRGDYKCSGYGDGGKSAGIKWYFDTDTLQCLAFKYNGCGGNANRFESIFECRQVCPLPADFGGCSGQKKSKGTCAMGPSGSRECPPGYRCKMQAFFGLCCHAETEDVYNRNFRPKCANGKEPHQLYDPVNKYSIVHLGKSCKDEFCPADTTTCHQQEIFANCCPK